MQVEGVQDVLPEVLVCPAQQVVAGFDAEGLQHLLECIGLCGERLVYLVPLFLGEVPVSCLYGVLDSVLKEP